MPKMKTHSGSKKRFKVTGTGKVKAQHAYKRHNLRKRDPQTKAQLRGTMVLSDSDARIILKNFLRNA